MNTRTGGAAQHALPLLEHDVLRTFVVIAETGSFTRAADRVCRSPSAVSMQIKRLEKVLGCTVFMRGPRRARLTSEGEALLDYARRLLELNEEAVAHFVSPTVKRLCSPILRSPLFRGASFGHRYGCSKRKPV